MGTNYPPNQPPNPNYPQQGYPQQGYPQQPQGYPPPGYGAPVPPPKKKMSPVVIVLIVLGSLFVLGAVAVVGTGFFLVHKARQAGLDPDLWQRSPGVAAAKMIAAANPDVEIVRVDEGRGLVTLRQKSTGKTVSLNFEDIKKGRISFTDEKGETATVQTSGEGVEVKTTEGTARFGSGADAKLPVWVPVLSGATPEGAVSGEGPKGLGGQYSITTSQKPEAVAQFYKDALTKEGFEATSEVTPFGHLVTGKNGKRTVRVTATASGSDTAVNVAFEEAN